MKKLLFVLTIIFISASYAKASPYAVTGTFSTDVVTTCSFILNSGNAIEVTPTASTVAGTSYCKYDLLSSANGNNIVSVSYKNLWGASSTVPFSYVKTLPPTPSNIHLEQ